MTEESVKACGTCKRVLPIGQFDPKFPARGVYRSICKECRRAYGRAHYLRNRPAYLARSRDQKREFRQANPERLLEYLATHPCIDCGETDPVVLEFDHVDPALKLATVGEMLHRKAWTEILSEIEKCVIRCANCHRRRTARQFNWSRLAFSPIETNGAGDGI